MFVIADQPNIIRRYVAVHFEFDQLLIEQFKYEPRGNQTTVLNKPTTYIGQILQLQLYLNQIEIRLFAEIKKWFGQRRPHQICLVKMVE